MKPIFLALLVSASLLAGAQDNANQVPYRTKTFSETAKSVEAETSGGNISVMGATASDARVDVYVRSNSNRNGERNLTNEEIQQRLEADYELDISINNGRIVAKAKPKRNNMDWKRALSISFHILVPQRVSTKLTTSGGNIELSNLSGQQTFTTSGGNLRLEQLSGNVNGTTSGGNIIVRHSKDELKLSTSGGNIEATECAGNLDLSTSGGSIRLNKLAGAIEATTSGGNVQGERIEGTLSAHTSGGNIQLNDLTCSLETSTSGGHIEVAIKSLTKSVHISNSGGNINLQLPKGAAADLNVRGRKINTDKLETFSGTVEEDQVRGKLNGGGTSVTVSASSGRVSLSFQ